MQKYRVTVGYLLCLLIVIGGGVVVVIHVKHQINKPRYFLVSRQSTPAKPKPKPKPSPAPVAVPTQTPAPSTIPNPSLSSSSETAEIDAAENSYECPTNRRNKPVAKVASILITAAQSRILVLRSRATT